MSDKRIVACGFSEEELQETEDELLRAVTDLGADRKATARLSRIISNKLGFLQRVVRAENFLESQGIKVTR